MTACQYCFPKCTGLSLDFREGRRLFLRFCFWLSNITREEEGRIVDDSMIPHSLAISLAIFFGGFCTDLHLLTVLKGWVAKEGWLDTNFGRLKKAWRTPLGRDGGSFLRAFGNVYICRYRLRRMIDRI